MKLVYFGTSSFAVPTLQRLAPHVILVVSQPDRPSGRGHQLLPTPVKAATLDLGLKVAAPIKARAPEFVEEIEELEADALVVASYGQILSERLLNAAKRGGINLHGSLLPYYRGAAPIQRAILNGDDKTGICLMQMDKGMDTGDEIARIETSIGADETYGELQDRLAILAADLAENWIDRIVDGKYSRNVQHHELATHAPKVEKAEAELRFGENAELAYNRFRAFTPSPGAFMQTKFGLLKVSRARCLQGTGASGTVLVGGEGCLVAFAEGALDLIEVQPEGKKRMSGKDFLNGTRTRPGDSLIGPN